MTKEHIHRYIRYKGYAKENYYRCIEQDCTHFQLREACLGKRSLCNKCHEVMTLTREDLKKAKPLCINCSNSKEAKLRRKGVEAFMTSAQLMPFKLD